MNNKFLQNKIAVPFYLMLSLMWMFGNNANAQQTINKQFYEAYINSDIEKWHKSMQQLKEQNKAQNNALIYEYTLAQYGYLGFCVNLNKSKEAALIIDSAIENAEKLSKIKQHAASGHALKSAFYGFKIIFSPFKSVYYGPKGLASLNNAMAANANHYHYLLEKANYLFNAPTMAGGNPKEALRYFEMAVKSLELQPQLTKQNWFYLNTLVLQANAYAQLGEKAKANATYQKILQIEPDFKWIKEEIYPKFKSGK